MQKSNKTTTVNKTVSTLEFFQWYTGLKDREQIVERLVSDDVVWDQHKYDYPLDREEVERLLNTDKMIIDDITETTQDYEMCFNGNLLVIIVDINCCPFI